MQVEGSKKGQRRSIRAFHQIRTSVGALPNYEFVSQDNCISEGLVGSPLLLAVWGGFLVLAALRNS